MRRLGCVAIVLAACTGGSGSTTAQEPRPPASGGANATLVSGEPTPRPPQQPPGQPDAPDPDAQFDATVAQVLVVFAALGKAVDAASTDTGTDCPRAAAALTAVLDDPQNQRVITANQQLAEDVALRGRLEEWTKAHMDELVDVLTKVQTADARCESDRGFQAFMTRFEAL